MIAAKVSRLVSAALPVLPDLGLRGGVSAARFALIVALASLISVEALGIYSLIILVTELVYRIHSFNFYQYTTREVATAPPEQRPILLWRQLLIQACIGVVVVPVAGGMAMYFLVPLEYLPVVAAIYLFHFIATQFELYAVALGNVRAFNLTHFVRKALWVGLFIAFAVYSPAVRNLSFVLLLWCAAEFAGLLLIVGLVGRMGMLRAGRFSWSGSWASQGLRTSALYFSGNLADQLTDFANKAVLKFTLGEAAVGVYTFFLSVANVALVTVQTTLLFRITPTCLREGSEGALPRVRHRLKRTGLAGVGLGAAMIVVAWALLPWLLGLAGRTELAAHSPLLVGAGSATLLMTAAAFVHLYLYALRSDRDLVWASVVSGAAGTAASSVLVPALGIGGAFGALVLAAAALLITRLWKASRTNPLGPACAG